MGNLCNCADNSDHMVAPPDPELPKQKSTKDKFIGYQQGRMQMIDGDLDVEILITPNCKIQPPRRHLSIADKRKSMEHFLTYRAQMKFKKVTNVDANYEIMGELGSGEFGTVCEGMHHRSKMPCAIKIVNKSKLQEHEIYSQLNKNEFEVVEETPHPHITRVFELMEDDMNFYIVTELMTGGDLANRIS